jgi:hypothetical protein
MVDDHLLSELPHFLVLALFERQLTGLYVYRVGSHHDGGDLGWPASVILAAVEWEVDVLGWAQTSWLSNKMPPAINKRPGDFFL